jgi:DNA-binding protein Fis
LDSLHLKASEIFTLQTEAEFKVREEESIRKTIEIVKKSILKGLDNQTIFEIADLAIEEIEKIRIELGK